MNFARQENSSVASFCLVAVSALTDSKCKELSKVPVQVDPELEHWLESVLKSLQQNLEGWHHRVL